MSLIPYLLQKCLSANAIMNKMSVPRSSAARTRSVRPSVCSAVPSSLQCAAPSRPSFSVPRGFPARVHLQPRVLRFMKGPCQTKKLRSFMPRNKQKKLRSVMLRSLSKMADTYSPANAVPSARAGLTSLFGMGRGGTPLPNRLNYGF